MSTQDNARQKPAWAARADRYETQARILRKSAEAMDADQLAQISRIITAADDCDEKARIIRANASRT